MSAARKESSRDATGVDVVASAVAPGRNAGQFPVVALGASAGGLEAFTTFLTHVPADSGLALVLVQHLDPHHDSMLVDLLARTTAMPVVQITNGMTLSPNRVHVIPPDAALTISGHVLELLPRGAARPQMPIDGFLRALAEARGSGVIAVILSGTGSDGSLGVQAVREHGGVTLAQDPAEAAFDGMPRSAIATGCVDLVLPAARLGEELARIARDPSLLQPAPPAHTDIPPGDEGALREALALLRAATGVDFGLYRQTTVRRRLQRRVALHRARGLPEYVEHLHADPGEVQKLAQDLLIPVTRFFRDPEVFAFMEETALPDLIRRAASDGLVRMWVPGCSTGEEAYSLAISFVETAEHLHSPVTCQVFATDVNETVLAKARRATYLENIAADVSPERLERFFTRAHGEYRLNRAVRDLCVFSRHDLLNDPSFSRMDLVSCRNLLIYLDTMQRHTLGVLHFALEPHGYLLLGRSETAASCSDLFEAVDKDARLFRARASVTGRVSPRSGSARDARWRTSVPMTLESAADPTTYEELVAANEELQSLNEELESSKEEIESVNEELRTLNQELRSRNIELHVAHEFAQATIDTVRSALVVLDHDHRVVNANRSFYKAFHLTPAEVERRRISEVAPEYFASPGITDLLEQVRAGRLAPEDVEIEFDLPGGESRVLVVNVRRFSPGDLFLLSAEDVTQLRQMEADRRQSQKMEAIGHLAAGVAHDFNNLLTVVLAGASLAMHDLPEASLARTNLESVVSAAQRAADLTRQLLAYAGKSRGYVERVALSDLVAQTASLLHASVPANVQLRLDLDRDLPRLLADPSHMHQVVANLLTNAIEAIGDKGGTVLVRTGRRRVGHDEIAGTDPGKKLRQGEYLFVEVQDSGVGMAEDTQRQMFDPFFTTKFTGRGLGLAAVQGIVRQHHGAIMVRSVAGRGTAITVLLATGQVPPSPVSAPDLPVLRRGTETILVVDDEELVLDLTRAALTSYGYEVITAAGGRQAIDVLRSTTGIAVVVLDSTMPGMDGVETLKGLRAIRPDVPVLVCSGLGDATVETKYADHGVSGFIHKPFTLRHLAERVAACLSPRD